MDMKILNNLMKASLAALLLIFIVTGCKEPGDISIDPVTYESPFTFTPSHGFPGSTVKIEGTGLDDVLQVGFGSVAGEVTSQSSTTINVVIPVGAMTGRIKLVKPSSVISSVDNFVVDETPIPTIIDFSPAIAGSGDVITITGNLLDEVDSVYIGNLKAEVTGTPTASQMQVIAPVGLKTAKINLYYTFMTDYGMLKPAISASDKELSLELPKITSIEPPANDLDIGDSVTIKGTMMDQVTMVEFGATSVTFTAWADTMITCYVPTGATTGNIRLTIFDGVVESAFVVNLPAISSITPEKGKEDAGIIRAFSITGTKLDLVDSVYMGTTKVNLTTKTASQLLFTMAGNKAGVITLYTKNGNVKTSAPFFFTGNMWINDWNTVFPVDRYDKFANNNFGSFAADETGDHALLTMGGAIHTKSFYLWGPPVGNDRFSLYTPNPNGVYLELDLNVISIDDSLKQQDGTLKFKVYMMDALGWGAGGEYAYGYNGPISYVMADGEWHHFRMHLKDFKASTNSGLYTPDMPASGDLRPSAFCHPNSLRIIAFVFGTANPSGNGNVVLGMDNVKFVIEE